MAINNEYRAVYPAIKNAIDHYFSVTGKNRYAGASFWVKLAVILSLIVTGYTALFIYGESSLLIVAACYVLINFGSTLFVVNVAHDASHQCISKNRSLNRLLSFSWNIMGISKYLWDIQHHFSHHNHTGIPRRDVDIDETYWIRYSPTHRFRPQFRYQHLYAPFLYMLFGIFVIFVKDFIMLYSGKLKSYGVKNLPRYFVWRLVGTKLVYIIISIILPILLLPFAGWQVLLIYLFTLSLSSGSMLVVLVIPHINEYAVRQEKEIIIKDQQDWVMQQLHASVDSSPESKWLGELLGGLNTHLLHHLFPNICHVHYRELTRVMRQVLSKRGIPYRERSFAGAVADHFKFLKQMGVRPAIPGKTNYPAAFIQDNVHKTAV